VLPTPLKWFGSGNRADHQSKVSPGRELGNHSVDFHHSRILVVDQFVWIHLAGFGELFSNIADQCRSQGRGALAGSCTRQGSGQTESLDPYGLILEDARKIPYRLVINCGPIESGIARFTPLAGQTRRYDHRHGQDTKFPHSLFIVR
jgi:hypothetical protein